MSISAALLVAEVRKVAEADPDHKQTYPDGRTLMGVYMDKMGQPSCIVGRALHSISPEVFALVGAEYNNQHPDSLWVKGIIDGDDEEMSWLMDVQAAQDLGFPWRSAVAQADECAKERNGVRA